MRTPSPGATTARRRSTADRLKAARQFYLAKKGVSQADVMRHASTSLGEAVSEATVSRVIAGRKMDGKKTEAVQLAVIKLTGRKNFFTATAAELLA